MNKAQKIKDELIKKLKKKYPGCLSGSLVSKPKGQRKSLICIFFDEAIGDGLPKELPKTQDGYSIFYSINCA